MNDDYLLRKIEDSHQSIAKTVSAYGDKVNKTDITVTRIDTKLTDFIDRIDKKMIIHDKSIETLNDAKATIFTSVKALWIFVPVAIGLAGFGIKQWANNFESRVKTLETERKETYNEFIKMLGDRKNYLNQETIQNIFANL